jgi:tRNA A-37 threonylcarbamoyl transferase component Bud32
MPPELARDPAAALEHLMGLVPEQWLRRLPARATFPWRPAGSDRPLVVKRFTGDAARERWYERLRSLASAPRGPARREAESLRELAAAGFPVPRPLAWFEGPPGSGASALVMEHLEHRETLRELFARTPPLAARPRLVELARLVARLHAAGFYHRDLYLEHVVVTGPRPGELALLDAGRARRERAPRERWFVKDLAALLHSAPAAQGDRARLRFLAHYLDAREDARGLDARRLDANAVQRPRRAFARAVVRKAARLAAHAPRHVHQAADPIPGAVRS